ncbi:LacI family DNA-binding transcriptional regulator [Miniimonas sp. S16]|uniref:LacI family DNA-binding transcriptional regulator n=1 Tax=Miniimonas sp. S16 TaxID=2171623 RepID=UPI001F30FC15|nr:LacI family DNA-binding transcriptional regulator [Miniimonas sp. S16]
MSAGRPAGMADVARLAGVSHQTVSRVLNNHPSVRPATRERVLAAMDDLSYRPNRLARALVTARSGLLGVVTSGSAKFGPMSTLMAIEETARAAGYSVHVTAVRPGEDDLLAAVARALGDFDSQAVEAVVVIAPRIRVVEALADITSRAPLLLVAAGVEPSDRYVAVGADQAAGARSALRHLVDLGHERIALLTGPPDWLDARERERGWHEELAAAGLQPAHVWAGDWSAEAGYRVGQEIASSASRPTAVAVANDQMALGLLRALGEAGIDVPGDISVTGFDDIEGTDYFRPPLTTVRQDFTELAQAAMTELLGAIEADRRAGDEPAREPAAGEGAEDGAGDRGAAAVVPELVVRASTAPPTR